MTRAIRAELEHLIQGLFQEEGRLRELVEGIVQASLDAEMERQIGARRYERNPQRQGQRNGYKSRQLKTRVGELKLRMPQLREGGFQSELFGRYQRHEAALLTTIAEMYYQGVSTRRVATIMEELGGFSVSATTVSRVAQELDEQLEQMRSRRLGEFAFLVIDARYEKIRVNGHVVSQAVLVTAGINSDGEREVLDWRVADSESEATWDDVFQALLKRGLSSLQLIVSDAHSGIRAAIKRRFQGVRWQRCRVHFNRELLKKLHWKHFRTANRDLQAVFRPENPPQCRAIAAEVAEKWRGISPKFSQMLEEGIDDCLTVCQFPPPQRRRLNTTNMLERLMKELKQRTRVIGIFPNRESCHRICGALLWEIHEKWRLESPYLALTT
jgi:putative transposase